MADELNDPSVEVSDVRTLFGKGKSEDDQEAINTGPPNTVGSIQVDDNAGLDYSTRNCEMNENDELFLLQAQIFIEDAESYRSIDHKIDYKSLQLYRFYHSLPFSMLRFFVIFVLHMLAFVEFPSSLTWTSDIRTQGERIKLPCGVTEAIEMLCYIFLSADIFLKSSIFGYHHLKINRWLTFEVLVLGVSVIDWAISVALGCEEVVRFRRMLRPIFIIQNSSLMKKILNSLRKTLSQILGVLLLMALHLYIFTLFGMLLFPKPAEHEKPSDDFHLSTALRNQSDRNSTDGNESEYFHTLTDSFMNLLVLLTTANNPDVTLPAYRRNRLYALFFIVFLIIGLYCFMNMLTAIVYNQFRGYFLNSMQSSLMRRRLAQRAAFECLKRRSVNLRCATLDGSGDTQLSSGHVSVRDLKLVISRAKMSYEQRIMLFDTITQGFVQDQMMTWNNFCSVLRMMERQVEHREKPQIRWFRQHSYLVKIQKIVCHRYFSFFGNFMAFLNVILISFELATEYSKSLSSSQSALRIINFLFILYYAAEQALILVCMGWRRYRYSKGNIFDGVIVIILLLSEVITIAWYGFPFFSKREVHGDFTLWNFVRLINILIMFRMIRVIWHIKTMAIVANTLIDLIKNLHSFGGLLVVMYYFYAILGMELFQKVIKYNKTTVNTSTNICGTYEQLDYWANNFDDFAAAIVVLWDVMVVNNWFVFLDAYAKYTNRWSYLYFIIWWLLSVLLALNLFTALILENFIMKWDRFHDTSRYEGRSRALSMSYDMNTLTVHDMFRPNLKEPTEEQIVEGLNSLKYFAVSSE